MPTATVNDITMYYEVHGEGEPLVLIGGLSNDVSDYARMIPELAQRYRVIAFDNRGVGRTDKPDAPYSIDMMAGDAASLLSALGVERAHILGVSMGGRIAIALTLAHPELVKSLILVSTFARRIPLTWWGNFRLDNPLMRLCGCCVRWETRIRSRTTPSSISFRRHATTTLPSDWARYARRR